MARGDKKKKWHEEITRRNVSSLSYGHEESHIPTLPDKDVADRFLYRIIFFLPRWLMAHTLRRPPWPRSMQGQGRGRAWRCRGCGLLSAARTGARRYQGMVRFPSAMSV